MHEDRCPECEEVLRADGKCIGCTHCECGVELAGQYNNGEWHEECAECRAGSLCDEAYDRET